MISNYSPMIFHTQSGLNNYLFSSQNKKFILLHPLLNFLINLHNCNVNIEELINNSPDEIQLPDYGFFNKVEFQLNYEKFKLLKESGYFLKNDTGNKLTGRLTPDIVKQTLANTSSVVLEVTEKCNLACDYCCYGNKYGNYAERKSADLSLEKAISLLKYVFELRNSTLNISYANKLQIGFYGGEPLLNISFIDGIINYLKSKKSIRNSFILTMTTNGVLLDKYMDYIVENNIHFSVSLDGNKNHNSYRVFHNQKSSFDKVFNNIKIFQKKYPKYFEEYVRFLSVLHNKNSIIEISNFIKKEFNKESNISEINPIGIKPDKIEEFYEIYKNPFADLQQQENYLKSSKNKRTSYADITSVTKTLHQHSSFVFKNYSQLMFGNTKFQNIIPTGTCMPFHYKTFLTVSGNILPCEKIGHQFSIGIIDNENKVQFDFEKIAKMYNKLYDKLQNQCCNCNNAMLCGQCVFNMKDIECKSPVCNGFMSGSEFAQYLSVQMSYLEKYPSQYNFIMKKIIGR